MADHIGRLLKEIHNHIAGYEKSIEDFLENEPIGQNSSQFEHLKCELNNIEVRINDLLGCLRSQDKYNNYRLKFLKIKLAFLKSCRDYEKVSVVENIINDLEPDSEFFLVHCPDMDNDVCDESDDDSSHIANLITGEDEAIAHKHLLEDLKDSGVFETINEFQRFESDFQAFTQAEDFIIKDFGAFTVLKDLSTKLNSILESKVSILIERKKAAEDIENQDDRNIENENISKSEDMICKTMKIIDEIMTKYYKTFITYASHASDLYSLLFADILDKDPSEIEKRVKRLKLTFHPDKTGLPGVISNEFYVLIQNCFKSEFGPSSATDHCRKRSTAYETNIYEYEKTANENYRIAKAHGNYLKNCTLVGDDLNYADLEELQTYEPDKIRLIYHAYLLSAFKYYKSACKIADTHRVMDKKLSLRKDMCLCFYLADKLIEAQLISISIFFLMENEWEYDEKQRNEADVFLKSLNEKIKNKYDQMAQKCEFSPSQKSSQAFNPADMQTNMNSSSTMVPPPPKKAESRVQNRSIELQPFIKPSQLDLRGSKMLSPRQQKEQKQQTNERLCSMVFYLINSRVLSLENQRQTLRATQALKLSKTTFLILKAVGAGFGFGGLALVSIAPEVAQIIQVGLALGAVGPLVASVLVACFFAYKSYQNYKFFTEKIACCKNMNRILQDAVNLFEGNMYLEFLKKLSEPYSDKDKTKCLIYIIRDNNNEIIDFKIDGEEIISALMFVDATSDCIAGLLNLIATVLISGQVEIIQMPFSKLRAKADDIFKTITRSERLKERARELDKKLTSWVREKLGKRTGLFRFFGRKTGTNLNDREQGKYEKNSYQARLYEIKLSAKVNLTILSLTMDYSKSGVEAAKSHMLELNKLILNSNFSLNEEVLLRHELLQDFFWIITGEQLPSFEKDFFESSFKDDTDDVNPFTLPKSQADIYFDEKIKNSKSQQEMLRVIKKKANFHLKMAKKTDQIHDLDHLIEYKKALKEFEKFYELDKSDASVCVDILNCYFHMNLFQKGLKFVKFVLNSKFFDKYNLIVNADIWLGFARIYRKLGQHENAFDAIKQSLKFKETKIAQNEERIIKKLMGKSSSKVEYYKKAQLNVTKREEKQTFKIVSIDGGGIRGIIPAMMLCEIERRAFTHVSDVVDLFAGTSTGALIAAGLAMPFEHDDERPLYRSSDILELYTTKSKQVFGTPKSRSIFGIDNLKYDNAGLKSLIRQTARDYNLIHARNDLLITAVRDHLISPEEFTKYDAVTSSAGAQISVYDALMASTAAPTFFEPHHFNGISYLDGGVLNNNPARLAYDHAISKQRIRPDDIQLLSLGTGDYLDCASLDVKKSKSLIYWAANISNITFDGQTRVTDKSLRDLLGTRYHRWQPFMEKPIQFDDCNSISKLMDLADQFIEENDDQINDIVKTFKKD